jgi:hypothetical protein
MTFVCTAQDGYFQRGPLDDLVLVSGTGPEATGTEEHQRPLGGKLDAITASASAAAA